jgi:hypothetical protein
MDRERLDLTALDPTRDTARWERLIGRINARASAELARRAAAQGAFAMVALWARPALAAAAALAAISAGTLIALERTAAPAAAIAHSVVEALEVPSPAAAWIDEDRAPTVDDLILILAADGGER